MTDEYVSEIEKSGLFRLDLLEKYWSRPESNVEWIRLSQSLIGAGLFLSTSQQQIWYEWSFLAELAVTRSVKLSEDKHR